MLDEIPDIPEPGVGAAGMEISTLASDEVISADRTISVRQAAAIMEAEAIGLLVLKDGDAMVGVISERDVVKAVASGADLDGPATDVGSGRTVKTAPPTSTVEQVAGEMLENYIRHVLIVDDGGQPSGVVSVRDLLAVVAI